MDKKPAKKGFLLFEILSGLVIFSTACLLMTWQRWEIIKQEQEALDRFQALSLARNTMESIRAEKKFSLPNKQMNQKFTVTAQQKPLSLQANKNLLIPENFKLVEVVVTWQSAMGMRSVKLVTGLSSL
ncbi:MAG TPA: type II secretion system protein [Candidatus Dependentiae bacterium]|nr:type II secretion system protein [Candidatus Dependentiae bacterium]